MELNKEVVGVSLIGDNKNCIGYVVKRSETVFDIQAREMFQHQLTNPLKTKNGTIGSRHRNHLHELLDEWIDNALKEKE